MAHQCVKCGKLYEGMPREIIEGCSCGSHFFFFIKDTQFEKLKEEKTLAIEMSQHEKNKVEADVRDMLGIKEEEPVILDLESVRVLAPGKFEIDIVNLFRRERPLIYKLEEGKYIIDIASTIKVGLDEINKKIRNPEKT